MNDKFNVTLVETETGYQVLYDNKCEFCEIYVADWQKRRNGPKIISEIRSCLSKATGLRKSVFAIRVRKTTGGAN